MKWRKIIIPVSLTVSAVCIWTFMTYEQIPERKAIAVGDIVMSVLKDYQVVYHVMYSLDGVQKENDVCLDIEEGIQGENDFLLMNIEGIN